MLQLITPLLKEVSNLPPTMQVMVVSALGIAVVWAAMRHIDRHAGGSY